MLFGTGPELTPPVRLLRHVTFSKSIKDISGVIKNPLGKPGGCHRWITGFGEL